MNQPKIQFIYKTILESGGLQILGIAGLVYFAILHTLYFVNFELCQLLYEGLTFVMVSVICSVFLFEAVVIKNALDELRHK